MDKMLEQQTLFKTVVISDLIVGNILINLGEVIEISEMENCYSLVISRMGQRQVWTFDKGIEMVIL